MKIYAEETLNSKFIFRALKINSINTEETELEYKDLNSLTKDSEVDVILFRNDSEVINYHRQHGAICYCCFPSESYHLVDNYSKQNKGSIRTCGRIAEKSFEVTSRGDKRFSPFFIKMYNGMTLEDFYHLEMKHHKYLGNKSWRDSKGTPPLVLGTYDRITREEAATDKSTLYIFTDNLQRTSGRNLITRGWYYDKYYIGKDLCYPTMTTAVLRGLDNSRPISTMFDCNKNQLSDNIIIEAYKETLEEELEDIRLAYKTDSYTRILFPKCQIGQGRYSKLSKEFQELLDYELAGLGWNNKIQESIFENLDPQEQFFNAYQDWFVNNLPFLYEALRLSENKVITDCFWHDQTKGSQAKVICDILNKVLN